MFVLKIHETSFLGSGEAGTVTKGTFEKGQQEYAIKTITKVDATTFLNPDRPEMKLYALLGDEDWHKTHIITPLAISRVVDAEGVERAQLILPLFSEGSVKDLMRRKEAESLLSGNEIPYLEFSQFEKLIRTIFDVLQQLHSHQITHMDFHPNQLMLQENEFYVNDFSRAADLSKMYGEVAKVIQMIKFLLVGPKKMLKIYEKLPFDFSPNEREALAGVDILQMYGESVISLLGNWASAAYKNEYKDMPYEVDYTKLGTEILDAVRENYFLPMSL